jgi:hypothetical protein
LQFTREEAIRLSIPIKPVGVISSAQKDDLTITLVKFVVFSIITTQPFGEEETNDLE